MAGTGTAVILRALSANFLIAVAKGVGAFITGSGAMLAETLHSLSDCINQLLLLLGLRQARRPPTPQHPLGQGRNLYFWSFMVAMLLFLGGGAYAIYEGIHKLHSPVEELANPLLAMAILAFALAIEGWAMAGAVKAINARRGDRPLMRYLRETKDSDLVVIFGEDAAACIGLVLALAAVGVAMITGDPRWDAIGTLCIGGVLVAVAVFLAVEVKSLLLGESADSALTAKIVAIANADANVVDVVETITVQQGPGEILLAMKLHFKAGLDIDTVVVVINDLEAALRAAIPDLKWCFIEPDHPAVAAVAAQV
ncbi:MAG: cation diffusion facilitator family transporter [Kofleriaceae bacterium]